MYSDYGAMQQAAQRRVYEMQRRARAAVERRECAHCAAQERECAEEKQEEKQNESAEERRTECCEEKPAERCEEQSENGDNELLVLMAVLLLLVSENADPRLIAALLYII